MRYYFILILSSFTFVLLAQSNSPEVIASAGEEFSADGQGSISFTLGEIAVSSYTIGDQLLTEGFHQPIAMTTPAFHVADLKFGLLAYPNPTGNYINILVNDLPDTKKLELGIVDVLGKSHHKIFRCPKWEL